MSESSSSTRRTWGEFEAVIEALHRKLHPKAVVTRNDFLPGKDSGQKRQIDTSIRYRLGPNELLIIVEARRHGRKIGIDEMTAFAATKKDVGANLGIMVAEKGFTRGARNIAARESISLYTLRDTLKEGWPGEVGVKVFVESTTLHVIGWSLLDEHDNPIDISAGDEPVQLFDKAAPDKELTLDDLVLEIWKKGGKLDGEQTFAFASENRTLSNEVADNFRFQISFRAETMRFAREATMELLGLTDASNGITHTDAFTIATQPGKDAKYYSEPDFWKGIKAPFAIVVNAYFVVVPGNLADAKKQQFASLLPKLQMEWKVQAGEKPLSFRC